jgi:hypothetical protein
MFFVRAMFHCIDPKKKQLFLPSFISEVEFSPTTQLAGESSANEFSLFPFFALRVSMTIRSVKRRKSDDTG